MEERTNQLRSKDSKCSAESPDLLGHVIVGRTYTAESTGETIEFKSSDAGTLTASFSTTFNIDRSGGKKVNVVMSGYYQVPPPHLSRWLIVLQSKPTHVEGTYGDTDYKAGAYTLVAYGKEGDSGSAPPLFTVARGSAEDIAGASGQTAIAKVVPFTLQPSA